MGYSTQGQLKNSNQLAKIAIFNNQIMNNVVFNTVGNTVILNGIANNVIVNIVASCDFINGHKYLFGTINKKGSSFTFDIRFNNILLDGDRGTLSIFEGYEIFQAEETKNMTMSCVIRNGYNCQNLIFIPIFVDLTKIYGVGNEPEDYNIVKNDYPEYFSLKGIAYNEDFAISRDYSPMNGNNEREAN